MKAAADLARHLVVTVEAELPEVAVVVNVAAVAVAARDNFRNWRLGIGLMVDLQFVPGCVMARQGLRKPDIRTNEYP